MSASAAAAAASSGQQQQQQQHPLPPPAPAPPAQWTEPPWSGWIETTGDALLILEAARQGLIPRVTRRLIDAERRMITSGSVFVFDEDESHIKRWTDGFFWSPSRILGNFLLYRETEKRGAGHRAAARAAEDAENNDTDGAPPATALSRPRTDGAPQGIDRQRERNLMGSLTNSYKFKPDGLMKKTFSVTIGGVAQHLISYYKIADVETGRLRPPSSLPELAALDISPEYLDKTHFRNPPKVEVGADGIPRYRGEADDADCTTPSPPLASISAPAPTTTAQLLSDPAQPAAAVTKRKRPDDLPHAKRPRRGTGSSAGTSGGGGGARTSTPTDPGSPPASQGSATPQPASASLPHASLPSSLPTSSLPASLPPPNPPPAAHPTAPPAPPPHTHAHIPPYQPYFFQYPAPAPPLPMYAAPPPPLAQPHGMSMGLYAHPHPHGSTPTGPGPASGPAGYAAYPQYASYAPHPQHAPSTPYGGQQPPHSPYGAHQGQGGQVQQPHAQQPHAGQQPAPAPAPPAHRNNPSQTAAAGPPGAYMGYYAPPPALGSGPGPGVVGAPLVTPGAGGVGQGGVGAPGGAQGPGAGATGGGYPPPPPQAYQWPMYSAYPPHAHPHPHPPYAHTLPPLALALAPAHGLGQGGQGQGQGGAQQGQQQQGQGQGGQGAQQQAAPRVDGTAGGSANAGAGASS